MQNSSYIYESRYPLFSTLSTKNQRSLPVDLTLTKGISLLEALCTSEKRRGVTELARELKLQKSNVSRLLKTLASIGYVERDEVSGKYGATLRIWEYGAMVSDRIDVRAVSRPYLEQLAVTSEETVHLSILSGAEVIYIDKVDSPTPLRSYTRVGGRAPAFCVATGKALLAFVDHQKLKQTLEGRLHQFTPSTISSLDALEKELRHIRKHGYALNLGEWRNGINGLAVPVFDHSGRAVASIGITLPPISPPQSLINLLTTCSTNISKALGYKVA